MPRLRVIILDQNVDSDLRCVMWADVPAARQSFYANATATSAWNGATATDITNIQNGSVTEQVLSQRVPGGTTIAQIEGYLAQQWQSFQNNINANNPWSHYGSTWDGTTWTIVTVA